MTDQELKNLVNKKYSEIALQADNQSVSCCGSDSDCCGSIDYTLMNEDYSGLKGYQPDADLGLGCGLPTEIAGIKKGEVVIDLGSGAGNDCFVAAVETGETGKVIGIDFSEAMVEKAKKNTEKIKYNNVSFRLGDIEAMPVGANYADVIISNCVLNLLPEKNKIFHEIFRVLKPGGHFSISDIVLNGDLPEGLKKDAEMYAGCISGAIRKDAYLIQIMSAGFQNIQIKKEKPIILPDELLSKYLSEEEINQFKSNGTNVISSITVNGVKPKVVSCCSPDSGCC